MKTALTFDDVLLVPQKSSVLPREVDLRTKLTRNIKLNIPLVSAAMDTVTEHATAIALAQQGGIGIIHKNLTPEKQAEEVKKVKSAEFHIVTKPRTISPETTIQEILELREMHNIASFPVVKNEKLVGIVTSRDLRFETNMKKKAKDIMSTDLITAEPKITIEEAKKILHKHRIEKLLLVDKQGKFKGMITATDIKRKEEYPNAVKDKKGRLLVGAAIGPKDFERAKLLIKADVDVLVIDTAHGHSKNVINAVEKLKEMYPKMEIIAGNVATAEATRDLIKAGADAVKVGVGPGAICTTRVISGVGVPQISAIIECAKAAKNKVPIIADGGIRYSGDITKAIAAGANAVMLGSIFAGCDETPGRIIYLYNRKYKQYRGMGSISAMMQGSKDRYMQSDIRQAEKLVPEGVEGVVPYKGSIKEVVYQLLGGLRSGMGLSGTKTIEELRRKGKLIQITQASLKESHPHDITITEEAPNYPGPWNRNI